MSALMISMIKVKEPAKLQEYLPKVSKIGSSYGAEMVFVGPATFSPGSSYYYYCYYDYLYY